MSAAKPAHRTHESTHGNERRGNPLTALPEAVASDAQSLSSADPQYYAISGPSDAPSVRILGSRCADTGKTLWPRRRYSPVTGGAVTDVELAVTGTIWSWTYVHLPWNGEFAPSSAPGYGVALVDLDDDGPRVVGMLIGDEGAYAVGDRVHAHALPIRRNGDEYDAMLAFRKEA